MNPNLVTTEIEQNASIITEVTQLPAVNTVVEESKTLQTIVDQDKTPIQTVVEENTSNIVSLVNQPTVQVTSVNGKTGDVQVDSEVSEFKPGKYYKRGTLTTYNGSAYIAKNDITPTTFNLADWEGVGGVQSDWNVTSSSDPSFIKNKPNLSTYATKIDLNTKAPVSHTHTIAQVTSLQATLDGKQAKLPTGDNNQFLSHNTTGPAWLSSHAQATWTAGTDDTPTTIAPSVLKATTKAHQVQPNWNATSGKGAILNKPAIPQVDVVKKFVANVEVDSSPDEQNLILTKESLNGSTEEVRVDLAEFISSLNIPIPQKPIYGMVRGRINAAAQVLGPNVTQDCLWDSNRKIEQNIQFLGESNSNAWLIPEDGIYTVTTTFDGVDQTKPFALRMQKRDVSGTWLSITPATVNSYPDNGRGLTVSTTQHFRKGELVNCAVTNLSADATRLGESDIYGHSQAYFTIARVATFGMDTQVSARPYNRLVKKVNPRVYVTGSSNKLMKFSFDVPKEFKGRKFKATFKLIYDYQNLNNTDRPRAVTEVFRRDWNGTSYIVDKKLFNKHTNGYHNYFELTEIYENTSTLVAIDIDLRDRDNVSPTQSASTDSAVILETID